METGVVTLVNTKQYPFNNSAKTIALKFEQNDTDYFVLTEIVSAAGEAGEVRVYGKAVNGFKIAFTGSAKNADVKYVIIGGSAL